MTNFVEDVLDLIDLELSTKIGDTFQNLTNDTGPFLTSIVSLYIIILGIGIWTNKIDANMNQVLKQIFKLATALGFFLSWPLFDEFIVDFITKAPDALAAKASGSPSSTITGALGSTFDSGMAFVSSVLSSGGWGLQYLLGLVVLICVLAQTGYALFLIILSKIAISLLLGLAPLFLIFSMFDSTRKMIDTWIQQIINYSLVIVFTITILAIMNSIIVTVITRASLSSDISLGQIVAPSIILILSTIILMQVTSITSSIAGGFQLSSFGSGRFALQNISRLGQMSARLALKSSQRFSNKSNPNRGGSIHRG